MSTLLVQPIDGELFQEVRFNLSTRCNIGAFIPYLLMFNSPDGTFTFEVYSEDQARIIYSHDFNSEDIKAALNTTRNYAHVFFPIVPSDPLQIEKGLYKMKIKSAGYTPSETSYLGWIQQFEDVQNILDYQPEDDSKNSLAIRFKNYTEGIQ